MSKKLDFNYIKHFIDKIGYKLLSTEYINAREPLSLMCDKGHMINMSFDSIKNAGYRCKVCSHIFLTDKQAHSFHHIKKYIEDRGYKLLSTEYKKARLKLDILCDNGHEFKMRFNNFQQGQRCPICAGNKKYSYVFVRNYMTNIGYNLITNEYNNNKENLIIECNNGHRFKMSLSALMNHKQRCPLCSFIEGKSRPEKEIVEHIKTIYGGEVLENDRSVIKNPNTGKMLELDIYLPNLKKAIEYNGLYWHSKEDVKQRDNLKKSLCKEKKIDLFVIKEEDWIKDKNVIFNYIENYIISPL